MCSNPDELHLRQLKQFAAVITAASVLGGWGGSTEESERMGNLPEDQS